MQIEDKGKVKSIEAPSAGKSRDTAGHMMYGITRRSIIIGLIVSLCHTCWLVYEEQALINLPPGFGYTTFVLIPSVIGIIFFFLILNSILKRLAPRLMFSPAELMVFFSMCTLSATISGGDLMQLLFPTIMAPYMPGGGNAEYEKFFAYVPKWFVPQKSDVIYSYFLGTHQFWGFFSKDIIIDWLKPLAFWGSFLFLMAWTMFCIVSLLRRQWLDREKLPFPILELPLTMVKENNIVSLFGSPLLRVSFIITAAVLSLNYLSSMYPSIPGIRLHLTNIASIMFVNPPLSGMAPVWISWWPFAIGLCYLVPLDILFSCWFFYVLIRLSMAFATAQGWRDPTAGFRPDQYPFFQNIAQGAWIGLFIAVMWSAKGHLLQIFRNAVNRNYIPDDSKEPMAYRNAIIGLLIGFAGLVSMLLISGLKLYLALLFFLIYFMAVTVMTRIYAQIAVPIFELYFFSSVSLTTNLVGTNTLNYSDASIFAHLHWMDRCYRPHPMGHELESVTFANKQNQSMRLMSKVTILAIVSGIVIGMLTILQISYNIGVPVAGPITSRIESWTRSVNWIANPQPVQLATIAKIGISMLIVFMLVFARSIWFGFPLHPIGYAFASGYSMEYIWNIVFVCWLIKFVVLRYGGLRMYRKSLPFFYGIILGDAVTQFVWTVGFCIFGVKGASPYLYPLW